MNKSSLRGTAFIKINSHHCQACWQCIEACPHNVLDNASILWHKHVIVRNASQCKGCMKCITVCPCGAITPTIHKENKNKVA